MSSTKIISTASGKTSGTKEWVKTLVTTVITSLITSAIGLYVWHVQFDSGIRQAKIEHKFTAIEKFSKSASYMIVMMRFMDRMHLDEQKEENKYLAKFTDVEKEMIKDPFTHNSFYIDYKKRAEIMKEMAKEDTNLNTYYLKALEYQSEYQSSYYSAIQFFDSKKIKEQMNRFNDLMQPEYYQKVVKDSLRDTKFFLNFDYGKVDGVLKEERNDMLKLIIANMIDEAKK